MGLFDKVNKDGTGSTGTFIQSVVLFAKLDLNGIFKSAIPALVNWFQGVGRIWDDIFNSNCNDQDAILVERFWDQIPGMAQLLAYLGYVDESFIEPFENDPGFQYTWMEGGRPKGAEPCNSLIGPARLLFTILFGVPIINSDFLDALENGVDAYRSAAGQWAVGIDQKAIERAVHLKRSYFQNWTYNRVIWNMNKFQDYPLVAPVPDPFAPGKYYTGEFLGVKIVDGWVIGDPLPDIQEYIRYFDTKTGTWKYASGPGWPVIPIEGLPTIPPADGSQTGDGSILDKITSFLQTADPFLLLAIAAAAGYAVYEVEQND